MVDDGVKHRVTSSTIRRMSRRNLHGINSIVIGAVALSLIAGVKRLEIYRDTHAGYLLQVIERIGWIVAPSRDATAQLKAWDPFSLNDGTAIVAAFAFGIYLALVSLGSALWARRRGEDNLYLSAGFMCGACALVFADYEWGIAGMIVAAAAMFLIRARTPSNH